MTVENGQGNQLVHKSPGELGTPQDRRIAAIITNRQTRTWRRRHITFFVKDDQETKRRALLPILNPQVPAGLFGRQLLYLPRSDLKGFIYSSSWRPADFIPEEYRILGPSQSWRDYSLNPPKKSFVELIFSKIGSVEEALRRAEKIRDKYRISGNGENQEALQILTTLDYLSGLRQKAMKKPVLQEDEFRQITEENAAFLTENRLLNPKNVGKIRIRDLLLKGFISANGNVNFLTLCSRLAAVELAARKNLEGAFPPTLIKHTAGAEVLRFERDVTRRYLNGIVSYLTEPISVDDLDKISRQLFYRVRVRPYLTVTQEAIITFGTMSLPGETKAYEEQFKRRELAIPTVADFLRAGDTSGANALLEQTRASFMEILDYYSDYKTVNLSKRSQKEAHKRLAEIDSLALPG